MFFLAAIPLAATGKVSCAASLPVWYLCPEWNLNTSVHIWPLLPLLSWRNGPLRYTTRREKRLRRERGDTWKPHSSGLIRHLKRDGGTRLSEWDRQPTAARETTKSLFWTLPLPLPNHSISFNPRGVCAFVSTHLAAVFQLPQPSLHILSGWIEPHLSRERMEIKLLHNCVGDAAKDVTEREVRVAFQKKKTYDVSQTRGEAEGRKKRGKAAEREEERKDNWHSSSLLLFARPSPAECRAVAQLLAPVVSHKAGRNVWPGSLGNGTSGPAAAVTAAGTWILPHRGEWRRAGRDWPWLFFLSLFFFFTPRWQTVRGCETKTRTGRSDALSLAGSFPRQDPSHRFTATWTHTKQPMNKQDIFPAFPSFVSLRLVMEFQNSFKSGAFSQNDLSINQFGVWLKRKRCLK